MINMSKSIANDVVMWLTCIILGLVALVFTQSIFNLFFVPIVVGVLWNSSNRIGRLEKRLAQLDGGAQTTEAVKGKEHPVTSEP